MTEPGGTSKAFWNRAARDNAAWHIATGFSAESEDFFASGQREVDAFLALGAVSLGPSSRVLEIGCGAGRMTGALAGKAGHVVGADVSDVMLAKARATLAAATNISFQELTGDGSLPFPDGAFDLVFSYVTMQHVPSKADQLRYVAESCRVLAPGGTVLIQFRRSDRTAIALDWVGHLKHVLAGRRTLHRAWRGARLTPSQLLGAVPDGFTARVISHGRRHNWLVAVKDR